MGQGSSKAPKQDGDTCFISNADVLEIFKNRALKQFTVPELVSFKNKVNTDLNKKITSEELAQWLHVPKEENILQELLYNFVQVLSNFPLIKESYESVTGVRLLKTIILTNPGRCKRYVKFKDYDELKLWFIALSNRKTIKEGPTTSSSVSSNETFDMMRILKGFDGVQIEELSIPLEYLVPFISWLLMLNTYCPTGNCKMEDAVIFEYWKSYMKSAHAICMSMKMKGESSYIEYRPFADTIRSISPHIFGPLPRIMEHLLYGDNELVEVSGNKSGLAFSTLHNPALLAQLFTALPKQFPVYQLQKLYLGREHGFSMRSFQAKVFKWNAPTILLLRGKRILDDEEYCAKNARYRKFLHEYPKLKSPGMDKMLEEIYPAKSKVMLAVNISAPWKITNKEYFGGPNTSIVQLSPFQEILPSSEENIMYFNTIGGGIGVGNKQPIIKQTTKTYSPGNVSLTMDSALEFAVLRHAGPGGSLRPGSIVGDKEFEIKLLLHDVEVWGCGGEKELEEQLARWEWEEAEAKRRQHINIQSLGEDRALLEMAGLVGQAQSGGSV